MSTVRMGPYRTGPAAPSLPRRAPWWRLLSWWARGGPQRLERARLRRSAEMAERTLAEIVARRVPLVMRFASGTLLDRIKHEEHSAMQ